MCAKPGSSPILSGKTGPDPFPFGTHLSLCRCSLQIHVYPQKHDPVLPREARSSPILSGGRFTSAQSIQALSRDTYSCPKEMLGTGHGGEGRQQERALFHLLRTQTVCKASTDVH